MTASTQFLSYLLQKKSIVMLFIGKKTLNCSQNRVTLKNTSAWKRTCKRAREAHTTFVNPWVFKSLLWIPRCRPWCSLENWGGQFQAQLMCKCFTLWKNAIIECIKRNMFFMMFIHPSIHPTIHLLPLTWLGPGAAP